MTAFWKKISTLLFALILLIGHTPANAQDYPVESTVQLLPPHALNLADYMDETGNGVLVTVLLKEIGRIQYPVRLRLTIESPDILIQTKSNYIPPPIFLDGGVPVTFTGADLAGYFNTRNLNITGNSANAIQRGQSMPEGLYTFRVEVLDYNRGVTVSNAGRSIAWLVRNEPPILNSPFNESLVEIREPQNIVFQWTPRHTASPNAAFNVHYQFELVEIRPKGRNPNDAMLSTPPIFETEVFGNSLFYGPGETQLLPGQEYAWRVKAIDDSGKDLFENDGYSEVHMFTYGEDCKPPESISSAGNNSSEVVINWNQSDLQDSYEIKFRKKTEENDASWHTYETEDNQIEIPNLIAETTYEFEVYSTCLGIQSQPSELLEVTTPELEPFACSDEAVPFTPINEVPIERLLYGDIITANQFEVFIVSAQRSGNGWSGTGRMTLPFLKSVRVSARFDNILVNSDYELIGGQVYTIHENVEDQPYLDLDSLWNSDEEIVIDHPIDDILVGTGTDTVIVVDGDIDTIFVNDNGDIIVVTEDGGESNVGPFGGDTDGDGNSEVALVDDNGEVFVISSDNPVATEGGTYGQGANGQPDSNFTPPDGDENRFDFIVQFNEDPVNATGGFDAPTYSAHDFYETTQIHEETYKVPWASVKSLRPSRVNASFSDEDEPTVVFRSAYGPYNTQITKQGNDYSTNFLIQGRSDKIEEELFAVGVDTVGDPDYEETLGKLNVISYDQKDLNIAIVPVNGDDTPIGDMRTELNKIFKQAVVNVTNLNILDGIQVEDWGPDKVFDDGDGNLFSSRSGDMNEVVKALKRRHGRDKNTYYIFLVPHTTATSGRKGSMPRGTQYGFMYTKNIYTTPELTKTIAHEIGHGAFGLRHTWEDYSQIGEGNTQNLMDKQEGTRLRKYQWDQMQDPGWVINLFDDDGEAAYDPWEMLNVGYTINQIPEKSDTDIISFLSPAGLIYSLPGRVRDLSFTNSGYLSAFTIDDERYVGFFDTEKLEFKGFKADNVEYSDGGGYANDPNSEYPNGYPDIHSKSLDFNSDINIYFVINGSSSNDNSDCGQAKLYMNLYKGDEITENNVGYNESNKHALFQYSATTIDICPSITFDESKFVTVSSPFNCYSKELKFFYKYIEYKHSITEDYEKEKLEDIITKMSAFGAVSITGFDNSETFSNEEIVTVDLDDYGNIFDGLSGSLDAYYNREQVDPTSTLLKVKIIQQGEDVIFSTYVDEMVPYIGVYKSILGCFEDESTLSPEGHYVPYCFWSNTQIGANLYYTSADPAFTSGIIDGGITLADETFKLLRELEKQKIAWTTRNLECAPNIEAFFTDYSTLLNNLKDISFNLSVLDKVVQAEMVEGYYQAEYYKMRLMMEITAMNALRDNINVDEENVKQLADMLRFFKEYLPEEFEDRSAKLAEMALLMSPVDAYTHETMSCDEAIATRAQLLEMLTLIKNLTSSDGGDMRSEAFDQMANSIKLYLATTTSTENTARYNHGKLVFEVALEVAGVYFTGGGANVANRISKLSSLTIKSVDDLIKFIGKQAKEIPGILTSKNKIFSKDGIELIEVSTENITYKVKKLAPDGADNLTLVDEDAVFTDVNYELPDGTTGRGDIEIVTDGTDDFVRLAKQAFSNLSADGTKLTLDPTDITKIADNSGTPIDRLNKVTQVEIRGKTYNLPEDKVITDAGNGEFHIPGFCFVAGTQVQIEKGMTAPIESIRKGEVVSSYNHETNRVELSKVQSLFKKTVDKLAKVVVAGSIFLSTVDHPYFANGEYIEASNLNPGDKVLMFDGGYGLVESITLKDTTVSVYNFQVANNHNYFIGESGFLVHNDCNMKRIDELFSSSSFPDKSKVTKYYDRIKDLPEAKRIAINQKVVDLGESKLPDFINDFHNKDMLSRFIEDPNLVDTWDMLFTSPVIRKEIASLDNLKDFMSLYRQNAFKANEWLEATSKINSSTSKRKLIENLSGKKTVDEVLQVIRQSAENNRIAMADKLTDLYGDDAYRLVKAAIRSSGPVHDNLASAFEKICNQDLTEMMDKLIDLYKGNPEIQEKIIEGFDRRYNKAQWKEVFKDYQAHHIIPINTLANESPIIRDIVEYALENNLFKVNDIDNLIFLDRNNHFGSHGAYDDMILSLVTKRVNDAKATGEYDLDEGVDILQEVVEGVKTELKNNYIGKNKKINTLNIQ